jgi:hypothetical protein
MFYTPRKRKYRYKPETIVETKAGAARFLTKCMVNQADKIGFCVILAKQEYDKIYDKDGKVETVRVGQVDMFPFDMALDAEKEGLCEILYNPFVPSVTGIPSNEKILNYYTQRFLNDLEKDKGRKEIVQ